jgi:hypothetical protein
MFSQYAKQFILVVQLNSSVWAAIQNVILALCPVDKETQITAELQGDQKVCVPDDYNTESYK